MEHHIDIGNIRKQNIFSLPKDKFSGKDKDGTELGFSNYYMMIDGKPFFAISGECHYSRVPEDRWEDTVLKMKAGGLNIISSYVFWNHHEEIEGKFRFDGRRNVRKFVETCRKYGMYVILRIGPFDHGEARNGGLPDWLYGKPFEVRSDNEGFLNCVRILYSKISEQVQGLLYKDGGPVIAVQIENEYMHSGAPWEMTTGISDEWVPAGKDGNEYMVKLKRIAIEEGIDTPFYTCTGWGGAAAPVDEMLPLWGGYAFWPWMFYHRDYVHPATPEYIYRDNHNSSVPETYNFEPGYDPETMPYSCCEMGGGMINFYNYRFQFPFESVDAMANIKMAGGCNFLGYYMYRGGSNPHGEKTEYLNEFQCPRISYDYQAPIGEFGQIRPSFYRLRTVHLFAKHFEDILCDLVTALPKESGDIAPEDTDSLRYALRTDGKKGFVFINNYQDHAECRDRANESIKIILKDEEIIIPDISIAACESAILPFNMDIEGTLLKYATAQPLSVIRDDSSVTYFFFIPEGMNGRFLFEDGEMYEAKGEEMLRFKKDCRNGTVNFAVLSRKQSFEYTEIDIKGHPVSFLSEGLAVCDGEKIRLEYMDEEVLNVTAERCGLSRYIIKLPELNEKAKDSLLKIDYRGDIGSLFDKNGTLVSDNFSNDAVWETGLKEINASSGDEYTLYITPRKKDVIVDVSSTMAGRKEKEDGSFAQLITAGITQVFEKVVPLQGSMEDIIQSLKENGMYVF